MSEPLDAPTPEQTAAVAEKIVDEWQHANRIVSGLMVGTGLTRPETLQYLMIRELAMIRTALEQRGINGMRFHAGCKACEQEKHFHELQLETMEQGLKHMREEHGDGWKEDA